LQNYGGLESVSLVYFEREIEAVQKLRIVLFLREIEWVLKVKNSRIIIVAIISQPCLGQN